MLYYPISSLVNALTSTILSIISIKQNPHAKLNRAFAYFSLSVASWAYCYFIWQISNTPTAALFCSRALMVGAIYVAPTFFHLSVSLINQGDKHISNIRLWYGVFSLFVLLNTTPLFVKDIRPRLFFFLLA